jgi:hypothetical protein
MRVQITTTQPTEMKRPTPVAPTDGVDAQTLPPYSREFIDDEYEYVQQADLDTKNGPVVNVADPRPTDDPILPTAHEPGYASESILQRGLQVPTKSSLVTSGFAYPMILSQCDITKEQWSNFTREITKEAKMTPSQWTTTVGKGFGTFIVGGLIFGALLGLLPAAVVGHKSRQHNEEKNLRLAKSTSILQEIINRWNVAVFQPRGLLIRVDLPGEVEGMDVMDVSTRCGIQPIIPSQAISEKPTRREMRASKKEMCIRWRAERKGRIVILPVGQQAAQFASTMPTRDTSPTGQSLLPPPIPERAPERATEQRTGVADFYSDEKRG